MSKTAKDLTAEELSIYRKAFWEREKRKEKASKSGLIWHGNWQENLPDY